MAYRVNNKRLKRVEESVNIVFDDKSPTQMFLVAQDEEESAQKDKPEQPKVDQENQEEETTQEQETVI